MPADDTGSNVPNTTPSSAPTSRPGLLLHLFRAKVPPPAGRKLALVAVSLPLLLIGALLAFPSSTAILPPPESATVEAVRRAEAVATGLPPLVGFEVSGTQASRAELTPEQELELRRGPSQNRPLDIACFEPVTVQPPAADLAEIVAGSEPGTCFRLGPGTYSFHNVQPKDYMTFLGASRSEVIVQGTSQTENAFSGTAVGVSIGRMTLRGFQGDAGEKRQEQGAIRGTAGVWLSDRGQMATEWLIDDVEVTDSYAVGIYIGDHFTVRNSVLRDNGVAGLGGSEVVGGLIHHNEVFGNGYEGIVTGYLAGSAGMKFGQSGTIEEPLVVTRNYVYENAGAGIWCDIGCNGFAATSNYVRDFRHGIVFEISANAQISNNLLVSSNIKGRNGYEAGAASILVRESANVLVEDNYITGGLYGVLVKQQKRPSLPNEDFLFRYDGVTFNTHDIVVRNNAVLDVAHVGVEVANNAKDMAAMDTINFVGNRYHHADEIRFMWDDNTNLMFEQWQASGRDAGPQPGLPPPPSWPPRDGEPLVFPAESG